MADVLVLVESNTTGTGKLFVEHARELGLAPLMLTEDATRYPYLQELDVPHLGCDTSSPAAVVRVCRALARPPAGVASSSELYVTVAATAARALGLPGEDPDRLAAARDKGVQRGLLTERGVACARHHVARTVADGVAAARALGLPVVVKPVSRSGSLGVRRCDTADAVAAHVATLLATTVDERGRPLPPTVLVESYLDGPEFSVEILAGEVRALVAKHVDESRGFLETGHDVPADLDRGTAGDLARTALAATAALGLGWGAAHVELRVVAGTPHVVEVNPRLAGGMIPQAIRAATGQDLIGEVVARSTGRAPVPRGRRTARASIRFLLPAGDGELRSVAGAAAAAALPGVVEATVTARPGRRVVREGSFLDRLGHVIAVGATGDEAAARAERAVGAIVAEIVPDPAGAAQP